MNTILAEVGTVLLRPGKDYLVQDWKEPTFIVLKQPKNWHFAFQPLKGIIMTRTKGRNEKPPIALM